jgi:hypothetical protein
LLLESNSLKHSFIENTITPQKNKEYVDFFGEDEEIEQLVREIAKNKEEIDEKNKFEK